MQCDQGCRLEALSASFPRLDATTASTTEFAYGDFVRTFALPSGGLQTLSARPTLPATCAAAAAAGSLAITTDPCLPFGLPCGTSCICLGCTDGDNCTGTPLVSAVGRYRLASSFPALDSWLTDCATTATTTTTSG